MPTFTNYGMLCVRLLNNFGVYNWHGSLWYKDGWPSSSITMDKNHPPGLNTKLSHVSWSFMYTTGWCMIFIYQSDYVKVKGLWNLCVATQNVHRLVLDYVTCHTKNSAQPKHPPFFSQQKPGEKNNKQKNGNLSEKNFQGGHRLVDRGCISFRTHGRASALRALTLDSPEKIHGENSQLPIYGQWCFQKWW